MAAHLETCDSDDAGTRDLLRQAWCRALVAPLRLRLREAGVLAGDDRAVQCSLFRKSRSRNWNVALHQDLSIPVAELVANESLCGWSLKQGAHFVQPPAALLERLTAVRIHLDPCSDADGPLRVVPGSHLAGKLAAQRARALRQDCGETACTAEPGDLLIMRPLLLHASSKASRPQGRRRVLHFLFGPSDPGHGLRWSLAI
jgi:ectoine hydroxylase-related dioxygenase (phytanoyl-CoA dioxygenase family)